MGTERPWGLLAHVSWNLRTIRPVSAQPWDSRLGSRSGLWAERRLPDHNSPGAREAAPVGGRSSDGGRTGRAGSGTLHEVTWHGSRQPGQEASTATVP